MKEPGQARELAEVMVELGAAHGVRTTALLTQMDVPLGRTAGNALEVVEAVEVLAGGGPPDVVELTLDLAREMLELAGLDDVDPAAALADGRAMDVWRRMVQAQGGDPSALLPRATGGRGRRRRRPPARSPASTPWPSASRPGGSAPAAAARRTTSPPPPASCGAPPSATTSRRASPSSSSTSTTRPASTSALEALADAIEITDDPVTPPPLVLGRVG